MRQAGFEAAKKAGDAKKSNSAKTKAQGKSSELSNVSSETLRKLDNSAPTGIPPPSGTTDASSAVAPESGSSTVKSKADGVPATTPKPNQVTDRMQDLDLTEANAASNPPAGSTDEPTSTGKDEDLEKRTSGAEKPEVEAQGAEEGGLNKGDHGSVKASTGKSESKAREGEADIEKDAEKTKDMTAASGEAQNLPGKKTQDQPAASGEDAGSSVVD